MKPFLSILWTFKINYSLVFQCFWECMEFLAVILVCSENTADCYACSVLAFIQYNGYSVLTFVREP